MGATEDGVACGAGKHVAESGAWAVGRRKGDGLRGTGPGGRGWVELGQGKREWRWAGRRGKEKRAGPGEKEKKKKKGMKEEKEMD